MNENSAPAASDEENKSGVVALLQFHILPISLILAAYLFAAFLSFDQMEEDAFIYFRAVDNISNGHGYVFNQGHERIEIGSSNLWVVLLFLINQLPISLISGAKFLGIGSGAATLCVAYALSYRLTQDRFFATFAGLATALTECFLFWSHRGLETPLHTLLIVTLVFLTMDRRLIKYSPWLIAIMLLGRPETPLILLGVVLAVLLHRIPLRTLLLPAGLLFGFGLLLELARLIYFGDLLPQPFYLKSDDGSGAGLRWVARFFGPWCFWGLGIPALLALFRRTSWSKSFTIVLGYTCLVVLWPIMSPDAKPYYRFVAPAVPLIWITLTYGVQHLVPLHRDVFRVATRVYCGLIMAVYVTTSSLDTHGIRDDAPLLVRAFGDFARQPVEYGRNIVAHLTKPDAAQSGKEILRDPIAGTYQWTVGEFIAKNYPEEIVVVYDQMGQTPYRAGQDKTFIDSFGLTDRTTGYSEFLTRESQGFLSRMYRPIFLRFVGRTADFYNRDRVLDRVFSAKPDLILINRVLTNLKPKSLTAALGSDPRLQRDYLNTFQLDTVVSVYERKGLSRTSSTVYVPDNLNVWDVHTRLLLN